MRGPPVVLTNTLGRPVTNIISERGAVPMVVVNTLGEPVTLVNSGGEPVTLFNPNGTLWDYPFSLFANAEQGAWYDPSDFSTLYQDSTGTTPVTAVEQPVGRMLDRSGRGNHATQATSASRPVLRARYNLLEQSEVFDNAYWTAVSATITPNASVAPNGTTTADRVTLTGGGGRIQRAITTTNTANSLHVKYVSGSGLWSIDTNGAAGADTTIFNIQTGAIVSTGANNSGTTITALPNGWYRISTSRGSTAGSNIYYGLGAGSSASDVLDIWGAQLQTAADEAATEGAYQRIAAATDYDTSNPVWRPYLAFDGTDDSFSTSSIDFSATDEVTVFAGAHKASDTAAAMLVELSANKNSNVGSFYITAPELTGASGNFGAIFRGSENNIYVASATTLAPVTAVITAFGNLSADSQTIRTNGTAVTGTPDMGTGNFGNYPLYIGRRGGATLPLNGRLYSLAVLGRTATAAEISAMEAWVNGKTGAF